MDEDGPIAVMFTPATGGVTPWIVPLNFAVAGVKAKAGEPLPTYDRPLTVEVWYPAVMPAV